MMLIVTSPWRMDVFLARIVMPFSRSRSLLSMTSVVLPWSTWAMIARFRMSCRISVTGLGNIRAAHEKDGGTTGGARIRVHLCVDRVGGAGSSRRGLGHHLVRVQHRRPHRLVPFHRRGHPGQFRLAPEARHLSVHPGPL